MRSQATKPLTKKGGLSKIQTNKNVAHKQIKKKIITKKIKTAAKNIVVKSPKKSLPKDDSIDNETSENSSEQISETKATNPKPGPSSRSDSPNKKAKKDKEKKESPKSLSEKTKTCLLKNNKLSDAMASKKNKNPTKAPKSNVSTDPSKHKNKSSINLKTDIPKKKSIKKTKKGSYPDDPNTSENICIETPDNKSVKPSSEKQKELILTDYQNSEPKSGEIKSSDSVDSSSVLPSQIQTEKTKTEVERPLKFFTSARSPRTVDIDFKFCKNVKANVVIPDRFVSAKSSNDPKTDNQVKEKAATANNLVSQGSDIDVYTFTEKVDSPKSILNDFRNPANKTIGRVRPIARVKGTIIDKKIDLDRKKFSPHRPIEEVVKQLKANKLGQNQDTETSSSVDSIVLSDEKIEEPPKPIVSKSYKMVARKTSIPGKPFTPIKLLDSTDIQKKNAKNVKKVKSKSKRFTDEEFENCTFSFNTNQKTQQYSSTEDSEDSNDDNKDSSDSDSIKKKKQNKNKNTKSTKEKSKNRKDDKSAESNTKEKPNKRRLKLLSMWTGPKKHRMASLNAIAKVHCLYENESRTHVELGLMRTIDRNTGTQPKTNNAKKKDDKNKMSDISETNSDSDFERKGKVDETSGEDTPPTRKLRGVPGIRSAGKYWDPKSSTSSSEDSEQDSKIKDSVQDKKKLLSKPIKPEVDKSKKSPVAQTKKKRNRNEVVMDLKDMVVQKRMASLNATAILAASYEKRSPKSNKDETTSDSCSDESFFQKSKNGPSSDLKSETKCEDTKKECEESIKTEKKQKVEVIVNQDTDVTITGVYSTHHHQGFCTVSGMQYRISSTSHTQTTATANCEKDGCSRDDEARYTPLSALSSMKPPADHKHGHSHPVEVGGLGRRAGCSSAFSAPSPSTHHEPGYYQPAGPLIKETGPEAERALARYHQPPAPHYHPTHPPIIQQYGPPYYPADLCYGRYYRPTGSYHMPAPPPQPDSQMVGVGSEPYPPPQYYSGPPCYQHSAQRLPYIEYRQCPCPMNAFPKNVLIGPATGKGPTGGGPDTPPSLPPPGAAFRPKVRAAGPRDSLADTHGSGKDPPLESEPAAAADAPRPCLLPPTIGGASPKREMYDARDNLRLAGELSSSVEALGPPSPARGSAGACAPQPPPSAPRRARLGKAMARRSLVGEDTGLLLAVSQPPPTPTQQSDGDDDVLAISPPACVPIDLSSSDETERRSTPLVDVKKENEGPTYITPRKTDAQALREQNCTAEATQQLNSSKGVKRRYSKPKLEIELGEIELNDGRRTNGIGEHVKLQKRRKVSSDLTDLTKRTESVTNKKKVTTPKAKKKVLSSPISEQKKPKRKLIDNMESPKAKKMHLEKTPSDELRLNRVINVISPERNIERPKTKSALLLDNLIRKNSIDRPDPKTDTDLDPVELFLSPSKNNLQITNKQTLNINNNVIVNKASNGVRPKTIEAVSQMIEKKLAAARNSCNLDLSVNSNQTPKTTSKTNSETNRQLDLSENKQISSTISDLNSHTTENQVTNKNNAVSDNNTEKITNKLYKSKGVLQNKTLENVALKTDSTEKEINKESTKLSVEKPKRCKLTVDKTNGELKAKGTEKHTSEKVVKLLVLKKSVIKADEAALLVEDACSSPVPMVKPGKRTKRRRSGARRPRRIPPLLALPEIDGKRAPPRWSNGWQWNGDPYISKVYLNNDSRLDKTARCWSRMTHDSGDEIARGDCVLLRANSPRAQPFVARVARLWENPEDGEMMMSLVWYYRPEHTEPERGRQPEDAPDEVFASKHRDANSVACIEDKCFVLTFNEYCRYKKRLKAAEEGIVIPPSIVPSMPANEITPAIATNDSKIPPNIPADLVLFCRNIYDFKSKKLQVPNK